MVGVGIKGEESKIWVIISEMAAGVSGKFAFEPVKEIDPRFQHRGYTACEEDSPKVLQQEDNWISLWH